MRQFFDFLTLVLTHKCKEDCFFCFIEKKNLSLNREAAKKAVDFFLRSEGEEKTIKFFGGDPLTEPGLLKSIVYFSEEKARELGKRVNFVLPTPGTLLNKEILNLIERHQIELVLNSAQLGKMKKGIFEKALALPFLTLTINIFPGSVRRLANDFKKFLGQGFGRFNLLPVYYIRWPKKSLRYLEKQLGKIKLLYQKYPSIYFKNQDLKGDVPLFNTCLTCDVSGELFSSNVILFKGLSGCREDLKLADVGSINNQAALKIEGERLVNIVKESFPKEILRDTFKADKILGAFFDSLGMPSVKIADIKVGNSCNNSCRFCVRRKKTGSTVDKTKAQILKNLLGGKKECSGVVFSGGEASIRKDFFELVSYARRLGYRRIQVQTNGRMFSYKDFCRKTVQAGANEFEVAIHGHIPQLHDYLTSCEGSFYQALQGIKNIQELGQPVFTNTVITKSNYRHLEQIAQLLTGLGVEQFQLAFAHGLGQAAENFESVVPRMSMAVPYIKKGLDIGINAGVRVMTEAVPYCLLGRYRNYAAENIIPSTKIFELFGRVIDFDKIRLELAKSKGPDCKRCRFFDTCEGVWREYPQRFGWEEFNPV